MLLKLKLLLLILIMSTLQSCLSAEKQNLIHHHTYNWDNLKLNEKHDLKISVGTNNPIFADGYNTYLDAQVAYSPFKKIGLQGGYHSICSNSSVYNYNNEFQIATLAVGGYHYKKFKNKRGRGYRKHRSKYKKRLKNFLAEIYGGIGIGNVRNSFRSHNAMFRLHQYFLKSSLQFQYKSASISVGMDAGFLKYPRGVLNFGFGESDLYSHFSKVKDNNSGGFIQPNLKFAFGKENLSWFFGASYFSKSKKWDLSSQRWLISYGLNLDLDGIFHSLQKLKY